MITTYNATGRTMDYWAIKLIKNGGLLDLVYFLEDFKVFILWKETNVMIKSYAKNYLKIPRFVFGERAATPGCDTLARILLSEEICHNY